MGRSQIVGAKRQGIITADSPPDGVPLGWLVKECVPSMPAAGYKYLTAQPAISTVLTGTANLKHLADNIDAILSGCS